MLKDNIRTNKDALDEPKPNSNSDVCESDTE